MLLAIPPAKNIVAKRIVPVTESLAPPRVMCDPEQYVLSNAWYLQRLCTHSCTNQRCRTTLDSSARMVFSFLQPQELSERYYTLWDEWL